MEERVQREHRKAFKAQLEMAKGFLQSAIDQLEAVSLDQLREESGYLVRSDAKRVFITHGHAEDVLRRVEDFVRALGFEPVVVKRGASLGGATDDVVEERMAECDAQIVLATGDDSVNGSLQPRMNVVHQIGLGQGLFKNHMIYLKESGCEFPSNVSPKIWQTFTRDDMSPAFEKIAKELRAMGLL
jgi:predicted nucleotide-binding protein